MSYTRPAYDSADASWVGASVYTRPAYDSADASWYEAPSGGGIRLMNIGVSQITGAHVGSSAVAAIYLGADIVWSAS
jgi:hypothetical protein